MTDKKLNSFKELESKRLDTLPDESKELVIDTINSIHHLFLFLGDGLLLQLQSMVKFVEMLGEDA